MSALRVVMFGDVDAGKSTILGRLMLDCGCVAPAKIEEMERSSERRGVPVEYSFLLDAFQIERDQAITLDSSRIWLKTPNREIVFVDAPGHRELIRNLVSGASEVDAAVLVISADEGITAQARRQALFLQWFGFTSVLVAINKLDLCAQPQRRFEERAAEADAFLRALGIAPSAIVPAAAREGANLARPGASTAWWRGRTLLAEIEALEAQRGDAAAPLRIAVQDIYRRGSTRWIVGRIDCGRVSRGDALTFWPLRTTARVNRIVRWPDDVESASAGAAVALELDERIFVDRGAIATHEEAGPTLGHTLSAALLWLGERPARAGANLRMRLGTREIAVTLAAIDERFDPEDGRGRPAEEIAAGDVAAVTLVARETIAADPALPASSISRFILLDAGRVVAGGKVRALASATRGAGATNVVATRSFVGREERGARNGHRGHVFWLTGLPSSGKSTVAMRVERMLFDRGRHAYVLDGDTLRTTLNVDLGFSEEERRENVRRTAALAGILADAGIVVIAALISPYAADRERARASCAAGFAEIYVDCDLATAEQRDVKGHYRRARAGELQGFTGISSPYELPERPDLVLETTRESVESSAARLFEFIERRIAEPLSSD